MYVPQLWPRSWRKVRPKRASPARCTFPQPRAGALEHPGLTWGCRGWGGAVTAAWGGCSCEGLRVMLGSKKLRLERNQRAVPGASVSQEISFLFRLSQVLFGPRKKG